MTLTTVMLTHRVQLDNISHSSRNVRQVGGFFRLDVLIIGHC